MIIGSAATMPPVETIHISTTCKKLKPSTFDLLVQYQVIPQLVTQHFTVLVSILYLNLHCRSRDDL